MILIVDNYDSFVFNVARAFEEQGAATRVVRNDAIAPDDVKPGETRAIVLSPGPRAPADAGISNALVRRFSGEIPILGICLGHQCIGEVFGGRVTRARQPMHGRASAIHHDGTGVFAGLPSPIEAARYHSLVVEPAADGPLAVTARSDDGEVMGLAHRSHPTYGVQFHPESILTTHGDSLIRTFLELLP